MRRTVYPRLPYAIAQPLLNRHGPGTPIERVAQVQLIGLVSIGVGVEIQWLLQLLQWYRAVIVCPIQV